MKIKLSEAVKKSKSRPNLSSSTPFLKLANAAVSGGQAKELVLDGKVLVNGEICTARGKKLYAGDRVSVFGKAYEVEENVSDRPAA